MAEVGQEILVYRGETVKLNMTSSTSLAGLTLAFTVAKKLNLSKKLIGPLAVTVLSPTTFTVTLTAAMTNLKPGSYVWDVWITDPGFEEVVAIGPFKQSGDARVPVAA